jgi:hypothetical protein
MTKPKMEPQHPAFPCRKEPMPESEPLPEWETANQPSRPDGKPDDSPSNSPIGHALDHFMGVWTEAEEQEFLKAIEPLEQVDWEMWDFGTFDSS